MKLIIEIDDVVYKKIVADKYAIYDKMFYSIKNGTLLPKGDLISRQAVLNEFYDVENLYERIKQLPPVNPQEPKYCDRNICTSNEYNGIGCDECEVTKSKEPKTGHWIVHPNGIYAHLVCDKCLSNAPFDCRTNYCPNCGCRMVEPQESEE